MWFKILRNWLKWRKDWDSLCKCCGKCCYARYASPTGQVYIDYEYPCDFLDEKTHLCTVYQDRFRKCDYCGKVTLRAALFNKLLPNDCAYRRTFRLWDKNTESKALRSDEETEEE